MVGPVLRLPLPCTRCSLDSCSGARKRNFKGLRDSERVTMATERCADCLLSNGRALLPLQALGRQLGAHGSPFPEPRVPAGGWATMAFELEEYLRAAFRDKLLLLKMPEREDDYLTPATRLLEKRRELAEVEQALLTQKEEFQMKMESLQQRRKELQHKEGQLKEAIFKFDKFLKDNDSKRSRALHKVSEQREQVVQKVVEAMQLRQEITRLLVERDRLQRHLEAHAIFRSYLQGVLEKTEQFQEIQALIDRFRTLTATNVALVQQDLGNREAMAEKRTQLQQYLEQSNNEIMQLNNQLAVLQAQREEARAKVHQWESKWTEIQNTATKKTLQLGQIKMATLNLFQLATKQMKLQVDVSLEDTETQLGTVQLCMLDLADILADLRKGAPAVQPSPAAAS
ncbi:cilia- and flagella-associated protein 73 [Dermochelys coriacea]|uniref:cilia- and flagella-associated protein 73 n=1 Tax=Dermochelys coriacea TaxID=27794 RepID=UPI0018E84531|nr:cilia- and flagella-associated protein 73 [Dermochelys coriacea]